MFKFWLLGLSLLIASAYLLTQHEIEQQANNTKLNDSNALGQTVKASSKTKLLKPDLQFPTDAGIFNVTDYGAKPNDGVDDTAKIQVAIATALKSKSRYSALPFIYFPKGTYNLSDQLESRVGSGGWSDGWRAGMILIGESGNRTVLKLTNNLAAFSNPKQPKAVIKTGSEKDTESNPSGAGNRAFRHSIYNMTIDVGRGNSGAVGIDYLANNRGAIEDVIIRSEGEGYAGILMKRYAPGPALVKNTSIEGFDYGVWIDNYEYSMTFEHLTLKNQRITGIFNQENVLNIRGLVSTNSVPVIDSVSNNGKITLLDSSFTGGAANKAAIATKGKMFVRNITSTGYGKVIDDRTKTDRDITNNSLTAKVQEYTSKAVESLADTPQRYSLSLPIEETPEFHSNDFRQWENVVTSGATPDDRSNDDAKAIQAAIDSNRAIVYLPRGEYHVGQTIILRGKVRKFLGMQASLKKKKGFSGDTLIRFEGGSTNDTILEHLRIDGIVEHASSQTLAMRHVDIGGYRNTTKGKGKLFVEDVIGAPYQINSPQKVWARQLNAEFGKVPLIQNHGGTVWILGLKTEGKVTAIETVGGTTELLGALLYPLHNVPASIPAFINDRGRVALSYAISGQKYAVQVQERQREQWRQLDSKNVPSRGKGANVPLYTGFISDQ